MARIRSIHPGLFTDEDFAALDPNVVLLFIGLLTEADDFGIFEWKPIGIRLRLRPGRDGPIEPLLDTLVGLDHLRRFEVDGKPYGAIRNFRKYQRPQKPTAKHPHPPELNDFIGLTKKTIVPAIPPDPSHYDRSTGIAPQMEEVIGGNIGERDKTPPLPPQGGVDVNFELVPDEGHGPNGAAHQPKKQKPRSAPPPDPNFDRWYAAYPRHVARDAAQRAWPGALALADFETLMRGARAYSALVAGREPDKIAHPATWLNGKRWTDEPPPQRATPPPGRADL